MALQKLGVKIDKYYASEINKAAIAQTQLNFPDTIQVGSVTELNAEDIGHIDLLIGGSPCQSFSFAGKRVGMVSELDEEITTLQRYMELKNAGFAFKGESFLFWEYIRILEDLKKINPKIKFLLENVEMQNKWEKVIDTATGVKGVHINSNLLSAQDRKRIYWTNSDYPILQPDDKGLIISDILQAEVEPATVVKSENWIKHISNVEKQKKRLIQVDGEKAIPLLARVYTNWGGNFISLPGGGYRKLSVRECSRLQTVPDSYMWDCSDSKAYKMLGNGWTVDVIAHVLLHTMADSLITF